jgi:hypothetical protein
LEVRAEFKDRAWVKVAYAQGVPMGGDLKPMSATDKAPSFAVWAVKDPTSGNLDRIQIIKGWTKSGQSFEKIFDVAWAGNREPDKWTGIVPPIGSTVDIVKGTFTNTIGAVELRTVWSDPEFDPSVPAFYYARVLEIPTPAWTTIQAAQLGIAPPDMVAPTIQERAWTSPIWYTPSAEAKATPKRGPTMDDLKKQGAVTQAMTPIDPAYLTSRFAENQGQSLQNYLGRSEPRRFVDDQSPQLCIVEHGSARPRWQSGRE